MSPARGVCISVTLRKSPACRCAGRLRGYELTLPRPCQGRPPAALSGRSSQVFGRVLGAVKLELLGLSLPPWTDPLVGGCYSAWPKASSSPSACREAIRGEAGGFTGRHRPRRIWHPGLATGPLKPISPRPQGQRCVNTRWPFEALALMLLQAGALSFWAEVIPPL